MVQDENNISGCAIWLFLGGVLLGCSIGFLFTMWTLSSFEGAFREACIQRVAEMIKGVDYYTASFVINTIPSVSEVTNLILVALVVVFVVLGIFSLIHGYKRIKEIRPSLAR